MSRHGAEWKRTHSEGYSTHLDVHNSGGGKAEGRMSGDRMADISRCRGQEVDLEMVRIKWWMRKNMCVFLVHSHMHIEENKKSAHPGLFLTSAVPSLILRTAHPWLMV